MKLFGQSGDFHRQLEQCWPRLYRLAYSWCHDVHLAGDLAQETMKKALANHHQLRDAVALDTWLFTILVNCWRDHHRRRKVTLDIVDLADDALIQHEHPGSENERLNLVHKVRDAIAKLDVDHRQVITLVDLEELPYAEVAKILDVPIGTVMSRVSRARRSLKQYLSEMRIDVANAKPDIRRIK